MIPADAATGENEVISANWNLCGVFGTMDRLNETT